MYTFFKHALFAGMQSRKVEILLPATPPPPPHTHTYTKQKTKQQQQQQQQQHYHQQTKRRRKHKKYIDDKAVVRNRYNRIPRHAPNIKLEKDTYN